MSNSFLIFYMSFFYVYSWTLLNCLWNFKNYSQFWLDISNSSDICREYTLLYENKLQALHALKLSISLLSTSLPIFNFKESLLRIRPIYCFRLKARKNLKYSQIPNSISKVSKRPKILENTEKGRKLKLIFALSKLGESK